MEACVLDEVEPGVQGVAICVNDSKEVKNDRN